MTKIIVVKNIGFGMKNIKTCFDTSIKHEKTELEGAQRVHISAKWIFLQLLCRVGRWCPVKTESLSQAVFEIRGLKDIRNDHNLELWRLRDGIDDVISRSATDHFLLVGNWYQVSISNRFLRYSHLNITRSRLWPFWVTWRHRWRHHWIRHGPFPING